MITRLLARESGRRFVCLGGSVFRAADLHEFPCDLIEHDPLLVDSIREAGRGVIPESDLELIARHTFTMYIRGEGGSIESARAVADVASALVRAGGLAVKVESSGIAHARQDWIKRTDLATPTGLYWAYVSLVSTSPRDDRTWSCGMHNFGLRDAITTMIWDPPKLATLMHAFLGMTFGGAGVRDGQKFADPSGVRYVIRAQPCETYPQGHMQFNPIGMWRLELLDNTDGGTADERG
jgi:hypothetical protein